MTCPGNTPRPPTHLHRQRLQRPQNLHHHLPDGPLSDGHYLLTFTAVTGFTTTYHLSPSADLVDPFFRLAGDVNSDGVVDSSDSDLVTANLGTSNAAADANGDGVVNSADLAFITTYLGNSIYP